MKKFFYAVTCFAVIGFMFSCSTKSTDLNELEVVTETDAPKFGVTIPVSSLPQPILDYVAANYPNSTITEAEEETDNSGNITYELHLDTGEELIFAPDGTLLAVGDDNDDDGDGNNDDDDDGMDDDDDGDNGTPINVGDLPNSIIEYVNFNYPGAVIVFAETEDGGYEVYLDNGVELHFDAQGRFLSAGSDDDDDGLDDDDDGLDDDDDGTSDDDDDGTSDDDDDGTSDDDDDGTSDDDDDGTSDDDDDGTSDDDDDGLDDDDDGTSDDDDDGLDDDDDGTSDDDDN